MKKRILAIAVAMCMVLTMMPMAAFAGTAVQQELPAVSADNENAAPNAALPPWGSDISSPDFTVSYTSKVKYGTEINRWTVDVDLLYKGQSMTATLYKVEYADMKEPGYYANGITITPRSEMLTGKIVLPVTIVSDQEDIGKATVNYTANNYYTGSAVKPAVTVTYSGKTLTAGTDYTVTYKDIVEIGTYSDAITIKGIGKYTGTKTLPVTISKKTIDFSKYDPLLVFDYTVAHNYTGKAVKPKVAVSYVGMPLVEGKDYTISYEVHSAPGTYFDAIKLVGKGDYSGTKKLYFAIKDPEVKATSITTCRLGTSAYNSVYVAWKKVAVTGATVKYKVEIKTGNGKWVKKVTGTKAVNTTIKGLKAGQKVSVRVTPFVVIGNKTFTAKAASKVKSIQIIKAPTQKAVAKTNKKAKVKVSWTKVTGASGYEVYRATAKNGKYTKVATVNKVNTLNKTVTAVKGKTNFYKIKAIVKVKVNGKTYTLRSPYSAVKSIKVKK